MSVPGFTAESAIDGAGHDGSESHMNARHKITIPGLASTEIGLGDAISRIALAAGIAPCGGCRERARVLNSWVVFTRR
jgi:hypothetical protein